MAGLIVRDETGMPWASGTGFTPPSPSVSSLGKISAGTSPSPDGTGEDRQGKFYIFPTDEHRVVKQTPRSAPAGLPPFALAEPHKPFERLTNSMPNLLTHAVGPVQVSSFKLSSDALSRSSINLPTRSTRESVEYDAVSGSILTEHKVYEADRPESVSPFEGRDTRDDGTGSAWDLPFRIEWVRTDSLSFLRTRHLRNPWNHDREVKVSRDGTELEPTVGQQLLDEWDRPSVPVDNSPGPSRTRQRRRRGSKSTKRSQ